MKLQLIEAGQIVTTHGLRGEVKVLPWVDSPEYLQDFDRVCIEGKSFDVETCRIQKGCCLMKLKGIDSQEAGMAMKDKTLSLYREDCDPETIFAAELMGVEVYAKGEQIGTIVDVLDYPGNLVYVVQGEHEYMIPAVKAFVLSTDLDQNRMEVNLIEGMRSDED